MNYDKIIFIHIAKTGGTSIVEYFQDKLPPGEFSSHGDFISITENPPLPNNYVGEKRFISGHFGFDYVKDYLQNAYSFTILRDPLSRILSFYKFCMHADMQKRFDVAKAAR